MTMEWRDEDTKYLLDDGEVRGGIYLEMERREEVLTWG